MRIIPFILLTLCLVDPATAGATRVIIHSARPFGYFVGDIIRARVEILAPAEAALSTASLPRPGPLNVSLDLRDVNFRETLDGANRRFDIDLVYQNFYVALDVRNIEIPPFALRIGDETVSVPGWSVGVAPLREISPAQLEHAEDYLRPDPAMLLVDSGRPKRLALVFAALSAFAVGAVAWDRGWPPFQRRRARIFNALARRLAAQARATPQEQEALAQAIQSMHRAMDSANGAALLFEDVSSFLARRPEFGSLHSSFQRFFAASRSAFFSQHDEPGADYSLAELASFAHALARQERRQ
jgi:mxaA protein